MKYDLILEEVEPGSENQVKQVFSELFPFLNSDQIEDIVAGSRIPFAYGKLPEATEMIMARLAEIRARVRAVVSPRDHPLLFPKEQLHSSPQIDEFINRWYSEQLIGLDEHSLIEWANSENVHEAYRFTFLPTFDSPIVIRIWIQGGQIQQGRIEFKVGSGQGGYHPGYVKAQKTRQLSDEEFNRIILAIKTHRFWTSSSWKTVPEGYGILDGEEYVFEGIKDKQYKVLTDQSPSDGAAYNVAIVLFELLPPEFQPAL